MSFAVVSAMLVMALLLRSERSGVGQLMIWEVVCLMLLSL